MLSYKVTRPFILMGLMLAVFAITAVSCAAEETPAPAQPALSEEQLRSIVSEAVAQAQPAPQQQVSGDEISAMVTAAMGAMTSSQVSASEIQSMVENAVAGAAAEGATPEQIQSMVESAVMAASADAVTGDDVQSAISQAVRSAQAGMITSADVKAAVEGAREGAVTSADVEAAVSSAVSAATLNTLTAEEIEEIVSKALEDRAMMEEVPKEPIIFSDLNWPSAQVQNRITQYIIEHGYGYPTEVILGGTLPNFQGLQNGDIDVALEVWLPNQSLGWQRAVELGEVVSVGIGGLEDWQSTFVVPKYIADANPDLKTPQDLAKPEFQSLFATAETGGKARLVGCLSTWACSMINAEQVAVYGLEDHVEIITPGSSEAVDAELYTIYGKQDPWLGYMWGTGNPAILLDLVRLEEVPYTEACWATDKACGFSESQVLKAVHKSLLPKAPDVVQFLQNWKMDVDTYKSIFRWMDPINAEASEAAIWYLNTYNVWEDWVTDEARARVRVALAEEA